MRKIAGLLVLLVVIVVVVVAVRLGGGKQGGPGGLPGRGEPVTLKGLLGGEKTAFLKDPEVVRILSERYGITVDASRRGSMEMIETSQAAGQDFLWPSNQVALELYQERTKNPAQAEVIFNSPIVLYSWASVTEALIKQGMVQKIGDAYYVVDMPGLVKAMNTGQEWKKIGLPQLYGKVLIYSTDPTTSSSGHLFAGLLANILNGGAVVNEGALPKILPTLKPFFETQGFMERSSDVIFRQFLNKGVGDKPIIVGYEAQLIEFSLENPETLRKLREPVRTLYPKPTVWSSHPLIALTTNGKRLLEALADKDIQQIAWKRHGFRSATGAENDVKALAVAGIPDTIENVIQMPSPHVMDRIMHSLSGQ